MVPIRCDTPWGQTDMPMVTGFMAIPPNHSGQIGRAIFRVLGLDSKIRGDYPASIEAFEAEAIPGAHQVLGIIYDRAGNELPRVVPRLVSVNMQPGY